MALFAKDAEYIFMLQIKSKGFLQIRKFNEIVTEMGVNPHCLNATNSAISTCQTKLEILTMLTALNSS